MHASAVHPHVLSPEIRTTKLPGMVSYLLANACRQPDMYTLTEPRHSIC